MNQHHTQQKITQPFHKRDLKTIKLNAYS